MRCHGLFFISDTDLFMMTLRYHLYLIETTGLIPIQMYPSQPLLIGPTSDRRNGQREHALYRWKSNQFVFKKSDSALLPV